MELLTAQLSLLGRKGRLGSEGSENAEGDLLVGCGIVSFARQCGIG